jgi:hypothetical protein
MELNFVDKFFDLTMCILMLSLLGKKNIIQLFLKYPQSMSFNKINMISHLDNFSWLLMNYQSIEMIKLDHYNSFVWKHHPRILTT